MKILLDECVPLDFRHHLAGHEVHTAEWAGLKGLRNGRLLRETESAGYDTLLTVDQGIPHQQNLHNLRISVVIVRSRTSQLEDLLPAVGAVLLVLETIRPGEIVVVPA